MRDTPYAKELTKAADVDGARIELLQIVGISEPEIRFSWWKDGKFVPRPLDLSEDDLLKLMRQAILERAVFTPKFLHGLQEILAERSRNA